MKTKNLLMTALLMLTLITCKKEDEDDVVSQTVEINVSNDLFNWIYFSFSENKIVAVTDFQNDLNWDFGVRYESFRTNGGASGIGQGGVYDLGLVDFASVTLNSLGNITFVEDDSINVIKVVGMPPQWEKVPGSVPLESAFQSPAGPPPNTYAPNNHVYIIKTASGKRVKFIGTSFFNDFAEEGYLNFEFMFLE